MKILAIEAATSMGGAALIEDETLLAEYRMDMTMAHAERLMAVVDRVLQDGRLSVRDLDGLAVSIGPGAFTGLRVAVNTVKGLAAGGSLSVAAVPTLEALAWNVPTGDGTVCPMIDAKKQEVYAALFLRRGDGEFERRMEDCVISPRRLAEHLTESSAGPTVFLGDGAHRYREILKDALADRAVFAPSPLSHPLPSIVAWLGQQKIRRGETADARSLVPVYLRRPDAELNREKGAASRR